MIWALCAWLCRWWCSFDEWVICEDPDELGYWLEPKMRP